MLNRSFIAAGIALVALGGCAYPVYQPVPVARLSPAQSAALANQPVDPAERARYQAADAQVAREDQAAQTYSYAYPSPAYSYPAYSYPYYAYPSAYYGGFYPWFPGLSLSLGFGGYYRGGYYRGGGYHGGYHGGYRGRR